MIRSLNQNDLSFVVSLENETLGESLGYDMLNSYLANPLAYLYILEDNNQKIGYVSTIFDGEVLEILNICILNNYQNKGYGKLLLGFLINQFNFKAKSIYLEVKKTNTYAIKLYEYYNFKCINIRKGYYKGIDALVYQRINSSYLDIFKNTLPKCIAYNYKSFVRYENNNNPYRFDNNFYLVINDIINAYTDIKKHIATNNIKHITVYSFDKNVILDDLIKDDLQVMYSVIPLIKTYKNTSFKAKVFDDNDDELLIKYLFIKDKAYGLSYANDNIKQILDLLDEGFYKFIGVINNNEIIGLAKISIYNNTILFEDFEVKEEYQNQGVGTSIINEMLVFARNNHLNEVYLLADLNETYNKMYEKMGFVNENIIYEYESD